MKKLLLSIVALVAAVTLWAVPAYRGWITMEQPDGTTIEIRQVGDEFYHYAVNKDGKQVRQNAEGFWEEVGEAPTAEKFQARRAAAKARRQPKAVGTKPNLAPKGVVILANFSNSKMQSSHTLAVFDELCNSENCTVNSGYPSAAQYFADQSNGAYRPVFDVFGPVTLSHNVAHYGNDIWVQDEETGEWYQDRGNDTLATDAVVEACKLADQQFTINWADYDSDNDGDIDFVYVIYAGKGQADGGTQETIWPHNWSVSSARYYHNCTYTANQCKVGGKNIENYAMSGEISGSSLSGIGTLCHEFGHVMGLPDLYDTKYETVYCNGVTPNDWNIMDGGSYNGDGHCPPNYDPWQKQFFGWLTPINLGTNGQDISIKANGTEGAKVYQINSSNTYQGATTSGVCYYIENRQKQGWDTPLTGHGMLVWKVNFNSSAWSNNAPNTTGTSGAPLHSVVSAYGTKIGYTYDYNEQGQAISGTGKDNCPWNTFPGTKKVTSYTPISGHAITNITESDGVISFKYNGGNVNYWTYGFEGTNCTITGEASGQVDKGAALNLTITPDAGYTLADADYWAVEMGSDLLEYGTGFTYNEGTGAFSIASVTGNVYIIATAQEVPATITWMDKGETFTTTQTSAGKLVLPENEPEACDGKVFVGWTATANYSSEDTAPTFVKSGDEATATTYYAVFATEEEGGEPTTITERMKTSSPYVALTGWTTNANDTYTSSGNYGASSPSLKLTSTGHYIQSALMESTITEVSYWYKSQGASGSSIDFYASTDGASFKKLAGETLTLGSSSGTKSITLDANDGYKAIKLVYQRSSGNVAIDDVSISYGGTSYSEYTTSCTTPTEVTVTFDANGGESTMDAQIIPYNTATALNECTFTKVGHSFAGWATTADGAVVYADEAEVTLKKNITLFAKWSINSYAINIASVSNGTISTSPAENANFGATVTVTATPNTHYTLGAISVVDANEQAVQLTGNTFTMPASNVTVSATFNEKATYTIRFFNNGAQVGADQVVHLDDTPEIPANPTPCDDEYTFVGWATSAIITETTEAPTTVSNFTVTGAQDYYAVYSRAEEGEGSGSFDGKTAGTYKIYAQVGETKYYAQGTGSKINSTTNEANATEYTIEAVTGGFAIKTGTTYITFSSSTDLGTSTSSYKWTFTSGTKGTWRVNSSTSGRAWIFRAGSTNKFGGYSTSNVTSDGDYYDLEISGGVNSTTYYTTAPDCSGEVYTITLDAGENGSLASSHETAKAGKTITITATPDQYFHLATITANDGAVELSGEGNTHTFTMPASDVTVSATFAEDDKYTIRFICEGEQIKVQELHLGQTADKPADPKASCDDYTFAGWWTAELAADNKEAKTWVTNFTVSGTQDYYAIFSKIEGGSLDSLTLTQGPTSGSSYNTSYSTTAKTAQGNTISIASNNILNSSSSIQLKAGTSNRIYNTSAMPGDITQITVTATTNSANVYIGSSSVASGSSALTPTSGSANSTATYTIPSGNTYFAVGATSSYVIISSIVVTYSSSTTYYSSTVNCGETGVEQTCTVSPANKVLQNGQIFILREGRTYTLTGNLVK